MAPTKFSPGVDAPGFESHSYDFRIDPGTHDREAKRWSAPENTRGVTSTYAVSDLENALRDVYSTDAHFVTYVVRDSSGSPLRVQPRINKPGVAWLRSQGFEPTVEVLVADVDHPAKADWTPELVADFERAFVQIATAGAYFTSHGYRLVQPLARPIAVDRVEPILRAWLSSLEALGIKPDWACIDWTRHFRLPNVRRAGKPYRSPCLSLERMRPIDPPVGVDVAGDAPRGPRKPRRVAPVIVAPKLAPAYSSYVEPIAAAIGLGGYLGMRHQLFLTLAGALLGRRVPPEQVPALIGEIARIADPAKVENATVGARDTVARWSAGFPVAGFAKLPPGMQEAVDAATDAQHARARAQAAATIPTRSLAESTAALEDAIRNAPDGLTIIQAQCGLGKTRAARVVALERSTREHATPGLHARAPLHSKTAISVPTTALAKEVVSSLRADGARVLRVFGVLSERADDGSPECRFYDSAKHFARGGQSVPWHFCRGGGVESEICPYLTTCKAADGQEGPEDSRIAVGPHAMLAQLDSWAGSTGLLVIDEPPSLLETHTIEIPEIELAEASLRYFESRYAAAVAPALRAVLEWTKSAEIDEPGPLDRAFALGVDAALLDAAFEATGATDAKACLENAFPENHKGSRAPHLRRTYAAMSRKNASFSAQIGGASRAIDRIYRTLTAAKSAARVELRGDRRILVLTLPVAALERAAARDGSVVVTDANADLHVPILRQCVDYDPPLHVFAAPDGAPIARTMIRTRATRSGWLERGKLTNVPAIARVVRLAVDWILEHREMSRVGFVTIPVVELALRSAQGEDVEAAWRKLGQDAGTLDECRRALAGVMLRLRSVVDLGHYGAVRGLDHWRDHDAIVTIGDPWPNLGAVRHDAAFLGMGDEWEARIEALARAELEQAHGRLRTVHRTKPGRALHVGSLMPGGWQEPIEIRRAPEGRPVNLASDNADVRELVDAVGGVSMAARRVGVDRSTVKRWLTASNAPPTAALESLRSASAVAAAQP